VRSRYVLAFSLSLLGLGCEDADVPRARLSVWAAASLAEVMPRVGDAFRAEAGADVSFGFDGSSRLARQIHAGAPADVFISADAQWMSWLDERARIEPDTRVDLLGNRLVVVVPASAGEPPEALEDLRDNRYERIAVAAEEVPAGRYAGAALAHHGLEDDLSTRFVRGANVRAALAYVAQGEADAGIVYRTDAIAEPRVREAFALDPASHPPIVYPAAVTRSSGDAATARHFLRFCRGQSARTIFADAGFEVP
jgi:molybdate transport system substrate-binding protein